MDFITTVCDNTAGKECPDWLGHPATAHWGFPDPAAVSGSEQEIVEAFRRVEMALLNRIELLLDLPISTLDHLQINEELHTIHNKSYE